MVLTKCLPDKTSKPVHLKKMSHKSVLTKRLPDKTSKLVLTKRLPDKTSKAVLTKCLPDKTSADLVLIPSDLATFILKKITNVSPWWLLIDLPSGAALMSN